VKHIIQINQHNIKHNIKCPVEDRKPIITNKTYKSNSYSNGLSILHKGEVVAKIVYSPDKPLNCGARLWIECDSEIVTIEEENNE
tara:strand:+ start:31 stop:285 length:255 start_codon:yes stop_codon:yes gene_type:complete